MNWEKLTKFGSTTYRFKIDDNATVKFVLVGSPYCWYYEDKTTGELKPTKGFEVLPFTETKDGGLVPDNSTLILTTGNRILKRMFDILDMKNALADYSNILFTVKRTGTSFETEYTVVADEKQWSVEIGNSDVVRVGDRHIDRVPLDKAIPGYVSSEQMEQGEVPTPPSQVADELYQDPKKAVDSVWGQKPSQPASSTSEVPQKVSDEIAKGLY